MTTPQPAPATDAATGAAGELTAEVGVQIGAPYTAGSPRQVTVIAEDGTGQRAQQRAAITVAEPGWTMWMVSHFHYDPVWWSTQGQFTESRMLLPDADGSLPDVRTAFELVRLHLEAARQDPGLQVRAGRDRLPQAAFRRASRGPRGPARVHQGGPDRDRRRQLQRAEHQPDLRRVDDPQRRLRAGLPAGDARRRPVGGLDAGRVRPRPGLPGPDGRGRPDRILLGPGAVPPVGAGPDGRRQPADAVRRRSSSGCRRMAPAC